MKTDELLDKLREKLPSEDEFAASFENLGKKSWTNNRVAIQRARDIIDALYRKESQITRTIDLIKQVIGKK